MNREPIAVDEVVLRPWNDVTAAERDAWVRLVDTLPAYDGPYFRPEFTELVASVRDDVHVAVLAGQGEPVGFLPLQRRGRHARPVGGRLSDFQGLIARPDLEWSPTELLRGCGLQSWHFDHLLDDRDALEPYHWFRAESPLMDLSGGFDAYEQGRRKAGSSDFKSSLRKDRKLRREHDVRFDARPDDEAFEKLLEWKARQYRDTQRTNVFSFEWTVALLDRLRSIDGPEFAGDFLALYVDDELAAVHLGMRSSRVLHYWFPAIGTGLEKYSPGLVLLLELARRSAAAGLGRIDLGKGDERYKQSFASGSIPVAEGVMETPTLSGLVRRGWRFTKEWVRKSPFAGAARLPARVLRAVRERTEFE